MQIKEQPHKSEKFGWWNRRAKGFAAITINNGTYSRKFKTAELYNAAREYMSKTRFENPFELQQWLSKLVNGFETDCTTVAMGDSLKLPNGIFLPAKKDITIWDD